MEITFTLRKNGGYMPNGLGSRLFPVDWQAGRPADRQKCHCCKLPNSLLIVFWMFELIFGIFNVIPMDLQWQRKEAKGARAPQILHQWGQSLPK